MPGHNNWFQTTLSANANNSKIPFTVMFNVDKIVETDFSKASDQSSILIAKNYKNIHLLLSGGLDSEYVAKVLLRNNIQFTPIIALINKLTDIEYAYAWNFCKQHNLTPLIFDYRNTHVELCKKILEESFRLGVAPNIGLVANVIANQLPTASILTGHGEPFHNSDLDHPMGDELEFEQYDWYLDTSKPNNPGAFFTYTPDIFYSLINSIDTSLTTQLAKSKLYNVPFRPKIKWRIKDITPCNLLPLLNIHQKSTQLSQLKISRFSVLNTFSAAFGVHPAIQTLPSMLI
jgi:hypothetical protein